MSKSDLAVSVFLVAVLIGLGYLFFGTPAASVGYQPVEIPGSTLTAYSGASWQGMQLFKVNLVEDGFITVHTALGDAPGPIIGVSGYLDRGLHDGTGVQLNPPLVFGQDYIALLHVDNGDQLFNVDEDFPVSSNEQVVRYDFTADVPATTE